LTKIYEMEKESKYDIDLSKINFEDYPKFSKKVYSDGFKVINKIIEKYGKKLPELADWIFFNPSLGSQEQESQCGGAFGSMK